MFSVGDDIKEMSWMSMDEVFRRKFPDFDKPLLVFSKPLVAAVDGYVVSVVDQFFLRSIHGSVKLFQTLFRALEVLF